MQCGSSKWLLQSFNGQQFVVCLACMVLCLAVVFLYDLRNQSNERTTECMAFISRGSLRESTNLLNNDDGCAQSYDIVICRDSL
jgi:hypothetical protein